MNILLAKRKKIRSKFLKIKIINFYGFSNILEYFLFHKVLNYLMYCGKKDKAFNHWLQLQFLIFLKKIKFKNLSNIKLINTRKNLTLNPISLFVFMLKRANIIVNLKKKKVAGRTHYIPLFLNSKQQVLFTLKNYILAARLRVLDVGIISKLYLELLSLISFDTTKNIESQLLKRKKWLYLQASENKFYIKFL